MIKRFNYTGRRKIPRDRVQVEVFDGTPRSFHASINLQGIDLLPHAAVFLEATCVGSTIIQRFAFGEVHNVRPHSPCVLSELDAENVFFALKIVDRTKRFGRLLGVTENIRPDRAGKQTVAGRRGILGIEPKDLGQRVWELDFEHPQVILNVNSTVPGLVDRARCDPLFYATAYPEVVRQILTRALEEHVDIEESDDRWPILWLRFGRNLHPMRQVPPNPDDSREEREEWVAEAIKAFCEAHRLKDKYAAAIAGSNGEAS
jgi:hypothetical protein